MTQEVQRQDLRNEILWYENNPWVKPDHFLMRWPFMHPERQKYAWKVVRKNARKIFGDYLEKNRRKIQKLLVAPCGTDADQDILEGFAEQFYGIDISQKAVALCPSSINKKVGNICESGYNADYFDAIASLLFFHHLHRVGCAPYLSEFHRILKKGGLLFLLEPGTLYFFSWLTFLGKKIFGNISGLVPDEAPLFPPKFTSTLGENGFQVERIQSVSFSHARIPVPLQKVINLCMKPLCAATGVNYLGWVIVWICKKI